MPNYNFSDKEAFALSIYLASKNQTSVKLYHRKKNRFKRKPIDY